MEGFVIENDKTADWAVQTIKEREEEHARIEALGKEKKAEIDIKVEEDRIKCENETRFLKAALAEYFNTVKTKETKTQKSYKLLSGNLVYKKPSYDYEKDEDALIFWAIVNNHRDVIETVHKLKWADFKKQLAIVGDEVVIAETGEVVSGIKPIEKEGKFEVK